ncbi:CHAT domain-containing protein [Streptomyces sp. G45]|uniref:CHAT domain-containing protein n=1 Tax=Streptomyces sp. G45 TaxID=3406627 RepID=UPI003C236D35
MVDVDFQVEIGLRGEEGYPTVFRTAGGEEAAGVLRLPSAREVESLAARVPDAVLASSARVRRAVVGEEAPVRDLGRMLFDALLGGTGTAMLLAARNRAAQRGGQVRLVLRVRPPELARLPWEFMYDTGEDAYLGLEVPLVRHPQVARPVAALRVVPPLRILGMVARPDDLEPLATRAEQRRLHDALADLIAEGRVELGWVTGQTWRDLRDAVRRDGRRPGQGGWHVLHFVGHGGFDTRAREGTLALAGERGGTHLLGAGDLAMLLTGHPSLRLAVLNSCESGRADGLNPFSSVAGALMRKGLPAVLAMQYEVSDDAALECARTFYEALARELPIDVAVMEARQAMAISRPHTLEWGTPVLYLRSLDGDGHLFDLARAAEEPPKPPPCAPGSEDESPPPAPEEARPPEARPPEARADLDELYADGLGALYTDRWDAAVEAFRTVIAHDRDFRDSEAKLVQARRGQRLAALYAAATKALEAQDWAEAIEHLQAVVATEPAHRDARDLLERARHEHVRARLRDEITTLHRTRQWEAVLAAAVRLNEQTRDDDPPPDPELESLVSTARQALEAAERERALARDYREALDHVDAGRWRQALERLTAVRDVRPDYRDAERLLARVRREAERAAPVLAEPVRVTSFNAPHALNAVSFSPDGSLLALACDFKVAVITTPAGDEQVRLSHGGMIASVWDAAFSPDGLRLATASGDRTARIWDSATGSQVLELAHPKTVRGVDFSPDGRHLATSCEDAAARVWDLATGAEILKVTHGSLVIGVAFSPDGRRLATSSGDKTARVWDAANGARLLELPHSGIVFSVAFSPDGGRLVTAQWNDAAHVWDADSGAELYAIAHKSITVDAAFSPDGRWVATASTDRSVRVCDADTGTELFDLEQFGGARSVAFSPDGRRLATGCSDRTVHLWRLDGDTADADL